MSREESTFDDFLKKERQIQEKEFKKIKQDKYNMLGAWIFTIPMIIWMIIEQVLGIVWPNKMFFSIGMLFLAIPPLFLFGKDTFTTALKAVIDGNVDMDLLIAIGSGIAFLTGLATFFAPIANYIDVAVTIIAFHLTGRYFEEKAKGSISHDIEELLEFKEEKATVVEEHQINQIPIEELKPGDIILVKSDETIPADGRIIKGNAKIDESTLTGRNSPVQKSVGDEVIGATNNQDGCIKVKVSRVGKDSYLSQFIKMHEKTENRSFDIQRHADRIISIFVPMVLVIALSSLLIWLLFPDVLHTIGNWAHMYLPWVNPQIGRLSLGIFSAIAVLVVACPCALGMAIPTVLLVGIEIGEENGILIQNDKTIETMQDADIIAFDMTGDITQDLLDKTEFRKINKELNELGIETAIICEKDRKTVEKLSDNADINLAVSEVSSEEDKLAELEKLKERFGVVAVIGDISNDSMMFTEADVGIGITRGGNITVNKADFLLIEGELSSLIGVVKLSRMIYKKVRENIFWAIIYNIVAIPFAMLAFLHPVIAELVMAGSSMSVLANARKLRRKNIKPEYKNN